MVRKPARCSNVAERFSPPPRDSPAELCTECLFPSLSSFLIPGSSCLARRRRGNTIPVVLQPRKGTKEARAGRTERRKMDGILITSVRGLLYRNNRDISSRSYPWSRRKKNQPGVALYRKGFKLRMKRSRNNCFQMMCLYKCNSIIPLWCNRVITGCSVDVAKKGPICRVQEPPSGKSLGIGEKGASGERQWLSG